MNKKRCAWVNELNPVYVKYHDFEWGKPLKRDQKLFEMLCLEGAQAGLNWEMILNKRDNYKKAFLNFDIKKCSKLSDKYLNNLLNDSGIVRNKLKVYSVRANARATLEIQKEWGSLSKYLWSYVDERPLQNNWKSINEIPSSTDLSQNISKDLKKRGFKFVGPTIIYAFMQAVGLVNDHTVDCFLFKD